MATCTDRPQQLGREVLLSWVAGCGSDDPRTTAAAPVTWNVLGFVSNSSFDRSVRTDTNNTEQSGAVTDTLTTGIDTSISVSLEDNKDTVDLTTQDELRQYIINELYADRQPTVWLRKFDTLHNRYEYHFCVATDNSQSAESEARRSGDFNFVVTPTYSTANPPYIDEAIPAP